MADLTREGRIKAAIKAIREKQILSTREASRTFRIPNSTLHKRLKGAQPPSVAHISSQRLTVPEEDAIEKTARQMKIWGWPLTIKALESLASNMLAKRNDFAPLGHDWYLKYLGRHPRLKTKKSRAMDQSRKDAGTYETLDHWFNLFNNTKAEYGVPDDDVHNLDEKGVMKGIGENQVVIITRDSKEATSAQPGNREWVTIIECIGGSGYVLAPFVI